MAVIVNAIGVQLLREESSGLCCELGSHTPVDMVQRTEGSLPLRAQPG